MTFSLVINPGRGASSGATVSKTGGLGAVISLFSAQCPACVQPSFVVRDVSALLQAVSC
jgi:hypothetical protein